MKKPIIAVDIDEVLAQHNLALVEFHNARYGTSHTLADYTTEHWSEVWQIPRDETERRAVEFHETGAHGSFEIVPGAQVAIKQLAQQYHLVALTVRRKITIENTHRWLEKYFQADIEAVRFVHAWEEPDTPSKAEVCKELGAQYLIDDSLKHCTIAADAGLESILFGDYPWNQSVSGLPEKVTRLADWPAVLEYFNARQA